jgi:hypothetical protein
MNIVYLRVFDNRPRARTFARGAWREFGYVYLLRNASAVSLTELLRRRSDPDFFIRSEAQLRAELDRAPTAPQPVGWRRISGIAGSTVLAYDRYGGYPVRTPMCHGDFWKTALDVLLERADLVVLDLSGFHTKFQGTQFEIQRLVDTIPIHQVVLLTDPKSNRRFIQEQVKLAWEHMDARSPNVGTGQREILCYRIDYFLAYEDEHKNTTRTELRASRTQTRSLLRDAQDRLGTPLGRIPPPPPPPQVWQWVAVAVAVAAAAALLLGVVSGRVDFTSGGFGAGWFPSGTSASVVPGSGYNLRAGPSTANAVVTAVPGGTEVVVECTAGNWARLSEPIAGTYIHSSGLLLRGSPNQC